MTTDKVYDNQEWAWPYRESDRLDGYDPYSNSKSCSELVTHSYLRSFLREQGVAVSTMRAGNVIGGGKDLASVTISADQAAAPLPIAKIQLWYQADGEMTAMWHDVSDVSAEQPLVIVIDQTAPEIELLPEEKDKILDYPLMVYACEGTQREKLDWFETINIAGEELTPQELRNAVFAGPWVSDAKRYFSKSNCPAKGLASGYVNGSPIPQDYLETAIRWIADVKKDEEIREYMAIHQHDANALALWTYFQSVITWVQGTFTRKRERFMKGVNWGELYNKYKDRVYDTTELEEKTARLLMDDDVTNKSGIYPYLLTGDERTLSIRAFTPAMAVAAYERQQGICPRCGKHFEFEAMEADHITPWHAGGRTVPENCQMLCKDCNRRKSGK